MSATPSIQSSAPSFTLATLRAALAELTAAYPDWTCRLERGANIVALQPIERGPCTQAWFVGSESHPGQAYSVWFFGFIHSLNHVSCTCPDYVKRGGPCKHALAVALYRRCERIEAEQDAQTGAADNVTAFPERAYSDDDRFELTPKGYSALTGESQPLS
jgi:hypothetical protein